MRSGPGETGVGGMRPATLKGARGRTLVIKMTETAFCSADWRTALPIGSRPGRIRAVGQRTEVTNHNERSWRAGFGGRPKLVATSSARDLNRAVAEVRGDLWGLSKGS